MKFSTREDIDAPIQDVFDALTEFESFERSAMRRGAEVHRTDTLKEPGVGMTWRAAFRMRGRTRELDLKMVSMERPDELVIHATSSAVSGAFVIELMALSRSRTRVNIGLELTPLNLAARLFIQSLKLTKSKLTKRFKLRVAEYAQLMEERLKNRA